MSEERKCVVVTRPYGVRTACGLTSGEVLARGDTVVLVQCQAERRKGRGVCKKCWAEIGRGALSDS